MDWGKRFSASAVIAWESQLLRGVVMRFPLLRRGCRAAQTIRNCRTEAALRIGGGDDFCGRHRAAKKCGLKLMQALKEMGGGGNGIQHLREGNTGMNGCPCSCGTPFELREGRAIWCEERALRDASRELSRHQDERHDRCIVRLGHAGRL